MSAMGSCIKVVKQKKLVSVRKKNVVSCNRVKPKRPLFCHGYSQNYKLTPIPLCRKLLRNFLLRLRSNKTQQDKHYIRLLSRTLKYTTKFEFSNLIIFDRSFIIQQHGSAEFLVITLELNFSSKKTFPRQKKNGSSSRLGCRSGSNL
jgi:hypothetical protein